MGPGERKSALSEAQLQTFLARLGVKGAWLSKTDIGAVAWLVKSWAGEPAGPCAAAAEWSSEAATITSKDFRRCLLMTVALNFGSGSDQALVSTAALPAARRAFASSCMCCDGSAGAGAGAVC